jgi:hypothetical protein
MELNIKTNAIIHSSNSMDTVTLLEKIGNNRYVADYRGTICVAMFNPFDGQFYADDIYGAIPPVPENQWEQAVQEMKYLCDSNEKELEAYRKLGSVADLRRLKRQEIRKSRRADRFHEHMVRLTVGCTAFIGIWTAIYYIALIV